MKKTILKTMLLTLLLTTLTFVLIACDNTVVPDPVRYTVIFDVNADGDAVQNEPDVARVDENTAVAEPSVDPIRSGYDFLGWYDNADGNGDAYDFSSPITSNNFIIYAVWSETVTYHDVLVDYQGGGSNETLSIAEGSTVTLDDPTREGYRFDGWYIDDTFSTAYNFSLVVNSDFTLYAKWVEQVIVTFDLNYSGAPTASEVSVDLGSVVATPTVPTRTDYTFAGWFEDAALSTPYEFSVINADVTVYAKWVDANAQTYTVSFDLNYTDAPSVNSQNITEGAIISQPSVSRVGYRFAGWFTDAELTTSFNITTPITAELTLYAKWTEAVVLTYDYNYQGALNPNPVIVDANVAITPMQNPSRTGYTFAGWSNSTLGLIGYDFSTGISEDTTVYAQWSMTYVYEAEDLDFSDFTGPGYSGNANGTDAIIRDDSNGVVNASNGYFISYLYADGIALTFTIESDREVDNATLSLRLSAEIMDFYITSTVGANLPTYTVTVNGTSINYGNVYFIDVPSQFEEISYLPFQDYVMSVNVSLVEGTNTVVLLTDNSIAMGGTMTATAPMVDAIKIETYAYLTWDVVSGNYN